MLEMLIEDERDFVDELLFADLFLWAFQFVRAKTDCRFNDGLDAVDTRRTGLGVEFNGHTRARVGAFDSLSRLQEAVTNKICMIEGSWDGDSFGWFVRLCAITEQPSARHPRYTDHGLCIVRGVKDQVEYATTLGEELARLARTTFYLTDPSPHFATFDDTKRWWDTQGTVR